MDKWAEKGAEKFEGKRTGRKTRMTTGGFGKLFLLLAALLLLLTYSGNQLLVRGILSWHLEQKPFHSMIMEIVVLFVVFTILYGMVTSGIWKLAGTFLVLAVFLWSHVVFLPVVIAGIYLVYVTAMGCFFNRMAAGGPKRCVTAFDGMLLDGFLSGCLLVIIAFCLMSAVGVGAIGNLQIFVMITGFLLLIPAGPGWKRRRQRIASNGSKRGENRKRWLTALCLSLLVTMLCIQAGRMNVAVDFDSLWYGVRSPYILDNGKGIYENLGTIGVVYTYSKGLEVLTLPLSNLPSYSFLISFNLWLAGGALYLAFCIARFYMKKGYALFFTALLSCVPGIMNMAATTKTDIATLLFQEIMIYYLLKYLREGRRQWKFLALSGASFFMTWTLKPTALIFSTALMGMSLVFLLLKRYTPWRRATGNAAMKEKAGKQRGGAAVLLLSILALSGIWARTFLITGLPVTSVFSSALTKLGFHLKYPFQASGIPNGGARLPFNERLTEFGKRLFNFLIRPSGEDMDHVILAWGGFLLLALVFVWLVCLCSGKRVKTGKERFLSSWLFVVFLPFLAVSVVSLYMLVQVDGNYFMLLYVLAGLAVFTMVAGLADERIKKGICACLIPVMCFGALMTSLTNWSWTVGFTPVSWKHVGYCDQLGAEHQQLVEKGNGQIWDILAGNSRNRLIAVGDHPGVLAFPCSAQSYDDITGIWGNVVLVKTMDNFVNFMRYAKTDYVYAQAGYMAEDERSYSLVRDLIEYGKLVPVCYEEGNLLARADVEGVYSKDSKAALTEFESRYRKKG